MKENYTINGFSTLMSFYCFVCQEKYSYDFVSNFRITINNSPSKICAVCASNLDVESYKKKYKSFKEVR